MLVELYLLIKGTSCRMLYHLSYHFCSLSMFLIKYLWPTTLATFPNFEPCHLLWDNWKMKYLNKQYQGNFFVQKSPTANVSQPDTNYNQFLNGGLQSINKLTTLEWAQPTWLQPFRIFKMLRLWKRFLAKQKLNGCFFCLMWDLR